MENTPKISIIIPVLNADLLKSCLTFIDKTNTSQSQYEVIIVNNDPQNTEIKEFSNEYKAKYFSLDKPGSYRARNLGAKKAEAEILGFIDVDCEMDKEWINQILENLISADALIGKTLGENQNKIARLEQRLYDEIYNDFTSKEKISRIDTRNFAIKKDVFKKLNGFNEKLAYGGDMEFGARLADFNFKILFNEKIVVKHHNPTKLRSIITKRITQNFDNYNITKFHPEDFIAKYFPHIYKYQKQEKFRFQIRLKYILFRLMLIFVFFLSPILIKTLPDNIAYLIYKKINGLCMHFGFMANILVRK
ncbi:MAG: glycosyltransferase [Patescibacteria group bacterium]